MTDETPVKDPPVSEELPEKEQFETEQRRLAQDQNLSEGSVPEQRPQAFLQNDSPKSELSERIEKAAPDTSAMPKSAYDKAASKSQAEKAAKASKTEGLLPSNVVKVTNEDSPHFGRVGAVTRIVSYRKDEDRIQRVMGSPDQLYVLPKEVEVRFRGDDRDGELTVLDVDKEKLEKVRDYRGTGRG